MPNNIEQEEQVIPPVRRYGTEAEGVFADLISPEKTAEQIREDERGAVQGRLDVIEEQALAERERVAQAGAETEGRVRAMASAGGLLTSPRGIGQVEKAKKATRTETRGVDVQKQSLITDVLDRADQRATEEIRFQQTRTDEGQRQYLNFLKENRDDVRQQVETLAQSDIPLENLKADNSYQQLVTETGYPEPVFDLLYEANRPEGGAEVVLSEKMEDGKLKILWKDKRTGEITQQEYDWGLPQPEVINGQPYLLERDENGEITGYNAVSGIAGDIMTVKGAGVVSISPDGSYNVIIPEEENFEFTNISGQGLYKISETGEATLIIPEIPQPAEAFYTASNLIDIAKTMEIGNTREITDPNTNDKYTIAGLKEKKEIEPLFKGADIVRFIDSTRRELPEGQSSTIEDPNTGFRVTATGKKEIPGVEPFYSSSDVINWIEDTRDKLAPNQSAVLEDPITKMKWTATGAKEEERLFKGSDIAKLLIELPEGQSVEIDDPVYGTRTITGMKKEEIKPFWTASAWASILAKIPEGETREVTNPNTGDTFTATGIVSDDPNIKVIQSTDEKGEVTITSYKVDGLGGIKLTGQASAGQIGKPSGGGASEPADVAGSISAGEAFVSANPNMSDSELKLQLGLDKNLTPSRVSSIIAGRRKISDESIKNDILFLTRQSTDDKGKLDLSTKADLKEIPVEKWLEGVKDYSEGDKKRALELLDQMITPAFEEAIKKVQADPKRFKITDEGIVDTGGVFGFKKTIFKFSDIPEAPTGSTTQAPQQTQTPIPTPTPAPQQPAPTPSPAPTPQPTPTTQSFTIQPHEKFKLGHPVSNIEGKDHPTTQAEIAKWRTKYLFDPQTKIWYQPSNPIYKPK